MSTQQPDPTNMAQLEQFAIAGLANIFAFMSVDAVSLSPDDWGTSAVLSNFAHACRNARSFQELTEDASKLHEQHINALLGMNANVCNERCLDLVAFVAHLPISDDSNPPKPATKLATVLLVQAEQAVGAGWRVLRDGGLVIEHSQKAYATMWLEEQCFTYAGSVTSDTPAEIWTRGEQN